MDGPTPLLNKNACKVLCDLLKLANEEFGNHGCNDYELPNTPENRELMEAVERWNSVEQWLEYGLHLNDNGTVIYTQDYFLMAYFAHVFEEESKSV